MNESWTPEVGQQTESILDTKALGQPCPYVKTARYGTSRHEPLLFIAA